MGVDFPKDHYQGDYLIEYAKELAEQHAYTVQLPSPLCQDLHQNESRLPEAVLLSFAQDCLNVFAW